MRSPTQADGISSSCLACSRAARIRSTMIRNSGSFGEGAFIPISPTVHAPPCCCCCCFRRCCWENPATHALVASLLGGCVNPSSRGCGEQMHAREELPHPGGHTDTPVGGYIGALLHAAAPKLHACRPCTRAKADPDPLHACAQAAALAACAVTGQTLTSEMCVYLTKQVRPMPPCARSVHFLRRNLIRDAYMQEKRATERPSSEAITLHTGALALGINRDKPVLLVSGL